MSKVVISKKKLTEQVESKLNVQVLADHYGLPLEQMRKALREAGLKAVRQPRYELVDDRLEGITSSPESGSQPLKEFSFQPISSDGILA